MFFWAFDIKPAREKSRSNHVFFFFCFSSINWLSNLPWICVTEFVSYSVSALLFLSRDYLLYFFIKTSSKGFHVRTSDCPRSYVSRSLGLFERGKRVFSPPPKRTPKPLSPSKTASSLPSKFFPPTSETFLLVCFLEGFR